MKRNLGPLIVLEDLQTRANSMARRSAIMQTVRLHASDETRRAHIDHKHGLSRAYDCIARLGF